MKQLTKREFLKGLGLASVTEIQNVLRKQGEYLG